MRFRDDGSVQASATPTYANVGTREDNTLYRCMVTKIIFTDLSDNFTSNSQSSRVLYDVVILGGFSAGQVISNCRLASTLGGDFNFFERTLRASSKNVSKVKLQDHDGDIVYVQFIQGDSSFPVIIALDEGLKTESSTGATSSEGQIMRAQYNGIFTEIDKNGNYTWLRKGGTFNEDDKFFTPASEENVKVEVSDQSVTITLKNGMTVSIDGNSDKVDITTKGGAKAEVDGSGDSVKISTSGGPKAEVLGSDDKVVLEAGTIELGEGASEKIVLGDSFKTTFDSHTHPTAVGPSGPPTMPMPGSNLSDKVKASS